MFRNYPRAPPASVIISLRTVPYAESFFRTYNGPLGQQFNQLRVHAANIDIATTGSVVPKTKDFNAASSFANYPEDGRIQPENENTETVVPFGYPFVLFHQQNGDEMDSLASIDNYRVRYNRIESDRYKVKFLEHDSVNVFREGLGKLAFLPSNSNVPYPLVIVPPQQHIACITMACILNKLINWDDFVRSIAYQNRLDLSTLWMYRSIDYIPDGTTKVRFDVDPISYRSILEKDFVLKFDGQYINIAVEENPWQDDMASYIINFLQNQLRP